MNDQERLAEDLWQAVFPIARAYVRWVAPCVLVWHLYSLFWASLHKAPTWSGYPLGALAIVVLTWHYWSCYSDLRSRKPVRIGGGIGIQSGDSIARGTLVVVLAIFVHFLLTLAAGIGNFSA